MRLEAVGKRYGLARPWIVRDVSLAVAAGRLIRLEGRNGSGKSTLLRVLAGVCVPSAGRVTGRPHTGYVPERFPPGLPFSPRNYLTHLGRVHGLRGAYLRSGVEDCLERLGAAPYADRTMRSLSKGMCQKVAVAQALLPQPGLLVLDEAWTGLDQAARDVLDAAVAQRVADGAAVVFVDHDPHRLAGLVTDRWRIDGAAVTVTPAQARAAGQAEAGSAAESGTAGSGTAGSGTAHSAGAGIAVIELSGVSGAELDGLAGLDGVRAVRGRGDSVLVSVDARRSDAFLRAALATGERVHVRAVRFEKSA
jgi:ABC-type Mn2+/Zn2+ transport system ATPase subunit